MLTIYFDIFIHRISPFLDPALPKRDEPRGGEFLQGAQDLHRRGSALHQRRVRRWFLPEKKGDLKQRKIPIDWMITLLILTIIDKIVIINGD